MAHHRVKCLDGTKASLGCEKLQVLYIVTVQCLRDEYYSACKR